MIFSGKYDDIVTSWLTSKVDMLKAVDLRNHRFSIYHHQYSLILVNSHLRTELFLLGIVYQILLFLQTL